MSLRILIDHRRFASQGFLLLVFCAAFAAFTLFVILRPVGEVEGQMKEPPGFTPEVSLDRGVHDSQVEEGGSFTVTVKITPVLQSNHDYQKCKNNTRGMRDENPCVEGGIVVWDTYNDHLPNGDLADELVAFIFFDGDDVDELTVFVEDDDCITPGRTIRIKINTAFDKDTYGYTIDDREITVNGNDTDRQIHNGDLTCDSKLPPGASETNGGGTVGNSAATGSPTISGTPEVGETLSASTSDIKDSNGLGNTDDGNGNGGNGGLPIPMAEGRQSHQQRRGYDLHFAGRR